MVVINLIPKKSVKYCRIRWAELKKKKKKVDKRSLMGRDPTKGIPAFKTGTQKTKKDRKSTRGDKYHDREKRKQLERD